MKQKKTNQERGRKYGGSSAFIDVGEPSKAPRQDEDGRELLGSARRDRHHVESDSDHQGISNRPVSEEHALPEPSAAEPGSVDIEPKQQGGNRGGV